MAPDKGIAQRLKEARERAGYTKTDVARTIGITPGMVGHIESGIRSVSVIILRQMAQLYNADLEWLITGHDSGTDRVASAIARDLEPLDQASRDRLLKMVKLWVDDRKALQAKAS